jgi:primary-amine oxidase
MAAFTLTPLEVLFMRYRPALFCALGLPALLLVLTGSSGQDVPAGAKEAAAQPEKKPQPKKTTSTVTEQTFPSNGVMETAWKVEWETKSGYGLIIKKAHFKRGPKDDWMQVLGDARVSEIFVPYHRGSPRFWDVSYGFDLSPVTREDAGAAGKLHTSSNGSEDVPCVVEELRDRGVMWKGDAGVRRGQVLILWGCLNAANYRYIMEYGFQDDGTITFRLGSTGHNLGGSEYEPHMHNALWRIQVNLDGPQNTVYLMETIETPGDAGKAKTIHTLFNNGVEGHADWDARKFTMLSVVNENKKNKQGKHFSYALMPSRMGTARHYGGDAKKREEDCTLHDFWVTRANPKELNYTKLPEYIDNKENIKNTDVVLWYSSPMHHEPRSEDGEIVNGRLVGCTHVGWSSFVLRPSNIFDRTPLYPYKK